MSFLLDGFRAVTWQQGVMYLVGFALIYLAIQKDYEPALLTRAAERLARLPLGGDAGAVVRAMANWLENMNSTNSVRTPSLARKMFWKMLLDTDAL